MKRLYSIIIAALLLGSTIPRATAAFEVSVDFFHENLQDYGDWREVGDYGYCWQPRGVDRDWRPYSDGRWLYTDAGWTWDSDEPYSWAVYHYGRWAQIDRVGWVWVPGTEWGPAWVSWRRSERHVGWAPLPPEARFTRSSGFGSRVDAEFDIGPASFRFIQVRDFGSRDMRRHFVEPRENITIINQTTNITQITYVNGNVYNYGPQYDAISRQSAEPIRRLKLDRRNEFAGDGGRSQREQLKARVDGESYRVMALPFDSKPSTAPKKLAAKVEKADVNRGWKDAGPAADVEKLRTKIKNEPVREKDAPQPGDGKITEVPADAPRVLLPGEKPGKGKIGDQPKRGDVPENAPEQEIPGKGKMNKGGKPDRADAPDAPKKQNKPEESGLPPAPADPEKAKPSNKPEKGKTKDREDTRPPQETPVKKQKDAPADAEKAKPSDKPEKGKSKDREDIRPPQEAPPKKQKDATEPRMQPKRNEQTQPPKDSAPPEQRKPDARKDNGGERKKPEPQPQVKRSEPRPQPAAEPESKKGKGKGKPDEEDDGKPDKKRK